MADALIGCTGFVGTNLFQQRPWSCTYSRSNIHEVVGQTFDTVVCCAAPGLKWWANQNPDADKKSVLDLIENLYSMSTERFILISTADVFGQPVCQNECDTPCPSTPYGEHRHRLEMFVRKRFTQWQIVRLPGLVGPGLKKGPYFDLLTENRLDYLNPDSRYQWYDVRNLWADIKDRTEPVLHLCPPTEALYATVDREFPHLRGRLNPRAAEVRYEMRTKYPRRFESYSRPIQQPSSHVAMSNASSS